MFPKECRSETKAINKVAEGVDKTTASDYSLCYFCFFLSTFCFSSFFHSLVIDFVAATPSPARENFTNVWWGGTLYYITVPLRRGTRK